ncbi:MAG: MFS transporter [Actinobacteria bacterium]|nr:MFS transporter [Actinomycetota bacterium]
MTTDGFLTKKGVRRSWYLYDWANSAFSTTVISLFIGPYLTSVAESGADASGMISLWGLDMRPGSLYPYAVSFSVFAQVFLLPIVGGIADRIKSRNGLLAVFAYIGSISTMFLYFVKDGRYALGAFLLIVANISFGAALVVANSYLQDLAAPDKRDTVSSRGWAFGYAGGGLLLLLNLVLYAGYESFGVTQGEAIRISLMSAGVWWAIFTIITVRGLRTLNRPVGAVGSQALTVGFKELKVTLKDVRKYPETLKFLIAYLFYNDGIQTVIAISGTYAILELKLTEISLVFAILIVQITALIGALLLGRLSNSIGAKKVILLTLVIWTVMVIITYALPAGQQNPYLVIAAGIGFVLGGSQALSRSLYSQVIPRSREAQFFSFYEISERGTSWLGTFAFGVAFGLTGSYRQSVLLIIAFFIVGGLLLLRVNIRQAITESGNPQPTVV